VVHQPAIASIGYLVEVVFELSCEFHHRHRAMLWVSTTGDANEAIQGGEDGKSMASARETIVYDQMNYDLEGIG